VRQWTGILTEKTQQW